ncbi:hypothetical protein BDN70DRAFT_925343 [Pholiota conissans]|uniref:F-box domain-containing protein n=1 Tax=Pholiota conissans TaxID=109636 RepID=A0A9P6CTK3_9AGAR|nr:hypothetical protein BDN70DRAFT_925343 [Pholiota conissans]
MRVCILDIPQELLTRILCGLDAVSLLKFAMTCKYSCKLYEESSILQYIVELYLNGVHDPDITSLLSRPVSYPDLINKLHDFRKAWTSPKWNLCQSLEMESPSIPFEYVSGLLVQCSDDSLEIATLYPELSNDRTINRTTNFPVEQCYFAVDPSQDLIVLIENDKSLIPVNKSRKAYIHIHTLSSDSPHPLARQSAPLEFNISRIPNTSDNNGMHDTQLQIVHNILMLQFRKGRPFIDGTLAILRVLIWDWTTSKLILNISSSAEEGAILPLEYCQVSLLTPDYFFTTYPAESGAIRFYRLQSDTESSPELPSSPIHLATLHFPPVYRNLRMEAGPIETQPTSTREPFVLNDEDRIHAFSLDYIYCDDDGQWHSAMPISMYLHQRVLMTYCTAAWATYTKTLKGQYSKLQVPWAEWGPQNTRIVFPSGTLAYPGRLNMLNSFVHGQRVMCPGPESYDGTEYGRRTVQPHRYNNMAVLDFSRAAVLTANGDPPFTHGTTTGELIPPTKITTSTLDPRVYQDDVETCLPCVAFNAGMRQPYDQYLMSTEGVVGILV